MAQKSYALLVAILVTFILLDCFTECGAAKNKGKGKGQARQKQKGKWRDFSGYGMALSKCIFDAEINYVCGSDGVVYWNSKNLECAKEFNADLKEAEQSSCASWPNTDEDKKKLANMYMEIVVEKAPETKRQKIKNNRQKDKKPTKPTYRKDKKKKDDKKKRKG